METERKRAFIINFFYMAILVSVAAAAVKWLLPMLTPFVLAFVFAYVLRGPTRFVSQKLQMKERTVALALVLLFYCTVGLLIGLLAIRAASEIRQLVEILPSLYNDWLAPILTECFTGAEQLIFQMDENLFALIQGFDDQFIQGLGNAVSSLSGKAVGAVSGFAASIPGLFIQLVLMIISTFFIAADYPVLKGFCVRQLSKHTLDLLRQIKRYVVGTLFVCIGSYFIIATLTFIELSIGLSILKVSHPIMIAFVIAIFDILPVLGTGGVMIPWAILSLFRGDLPRALGLLVVYVAITVIRNVVEPKIVGSQLGLHPVVTLASMFAGVQLCGVVGLFGFPIALSLLRYLNDNGTIHILKEPPKRDGEN